LAQAESSSESGRLFRRALDLMSLIDLGLSITLEEIKIDDMYAMMVIREEQKNLEEERENSKNGL
jgi:hypothetical protein